MRLPNGLLVLVVAVALLASVLLAGLAAAQTDAPQARTLTEVEMLMAGAQADRLDVVLYFLDRGVSANAVGKDGFTPLIVAAGQGSDSVVELLLARGADIDRANAKGWTALMEAAYRDRDAMVRQLLKAGARVDLREAREGLTAL
ncbi:MAG: ankyrin repeat domain-containing protein, partial [Hyphomicrobiales bacterium]|nr:ankyrin repeat domain-containing protein [Hyphomicrobiales bacterium]